MNICLQNLPYFRFVFEHISNFRRTSQLRRRYGIVLFAYISADFAEIRFLRRKQHLTLLHLCRICRIQYKISIFFTFVHYYQIFTVCSYTHRGDTVIIVIYKFV